MTTRHFASALGALALMASSAFAVNIVVAPGTGVGGANPTNTILDAISQINVAGPGSHTVTLRSTEGAHILPDNTSWIVSPDINVDFVAETGQPVVVLNDGPSANIMLTVTAGVASNDQTETVSFDGIAFIPETGLSYANNVADGMALNAGVFVFTDCVFASNDGSNGPATQETSFAYVQPPGGNNCGDDWIQVNSPNDATFSNCTITGCNDDAILFAGGSGGNIATLTVDQGTAIGNIGGAAIQVFSDGAAVVIDGSAGRVQMARCGLRTGVGAATDTGPKFFWDTGCSLDMTEADLMNTSNAGIFDFEGVPTINITDSRLAFCNTGNVATAAILAVDDLSADSAYTQVITIRRSTFHDAGGTTNPQSIKIADGANDPVPAFFILDSIFSGASDEFEMRNGVLGVTNQSNTAVVTAGPHAVASVGDMGAGAVSADPQYASLVYTMGRNQLNPLFLLPQNTTAYNNAAGDQSDLLGGAGSAGGSLPMELSIFSTN